MAKDDPPKEVEWNPTQALPDEEDETEAKREAARRARVDYLKQTLDKRRPKEEEKPKKKSIW